MGLKDKIKQGKEKLDTRTRAMKTKQETHRPKLRLRTHSNWGELFLNINSQKSKLDTENDN